MQKFWQMALTSAFFSLYSADVEAAPFRLLLERDTDANAGAELFLATYPTFDALLAGSLTQSGFSQIDIGSTFSAGGLAYDGQYRLLLERDTDANAGAELFLATYPTFDALLDASLTQSGFSQIDIGSTFSAGGLAYETSAGNGGPDMGAVPLPASGPFLMVGLVLVAAFGSKNRSVKRLMLMIKRC
jgi:hypothetical protein